MDEVAGLVLKDKMTPKQDKLGKHISRQQKLKQLYSRCTLQRLGFGWNSSFVISAVLGHCRSWSDSLGLGNPQRQQRSFRHKQNTHCSHSKVETTITCHRIRPISLCNVMFQIITKIIANRLKLVLPELIDETQAVFVHDCQITGNAIVVFEAFHYMKN